MKVNTVHLSGNQVEAGPAIEEGHVEYLMLEKESFEETIKLSEDVQILRVWLTTTRFTINAIGMHAAKNIGQESPAEVFLELCHAPTGHFKRMPPYRIDAVEKCFQLIHAVMIPKDLIFGTTTTQQILVSWYPNGPDGGLECFPVTMPVSPENMQFLNTLAQNLRPAKEVTLEEKVDQMKEQLEETSKLLRQLITEFRASRTVPLKPEHV